MKIHMQDYLIDKKEKMIPWICWMLLKSKNDFTFKGIDYNVQDVIKKHKRMQRNGQVVKRFKRVGSVVLPCLTHISNGDHHHHMAGLSAIAMELSPKRVLYVELVSQLEITMERFDG